MEVLSFEGQLRAGSELTLSMSSLTLKVQVRAVCGVCGRGAVCGGVVCGGATRGAACGGAGLRTGVGGGVAGLGLQVAVGRGQRVVAAWPVGVSLAPRAARAPLAPSSLCRGCSQFSGVVESWWEALLVRSRRGRVDVVSLARILLTKREES